MTSRKFASASLGAIFVLSAGLARAADDVPTQDRFNVALAYLKDHIAAAHQAGGDPPALADGGDAEANIRIVFDDRVPGTLDTNNIAQVIQVCGAPVRLMGEYAYWKTAGGADAALKYQDEISLATRFNIACGDAMLATAVVFWNALPESDRTDARRDGIHQMKHGIAEEYQGVALMQTEPMSAANRRLTLDAALKHVDVISQNIGVAERSTVISSIDSVLRSDTLDADTRDELKRIRTAMGRTDCTGLCPL